MTATVFIFVLLASFASADHFLERYSINLGCVTRSSESVIRSIDYPGVPPIPYNGVDEDALWSSKESCAKECDDLQGCLGFEFFTYVSDTATGLRCYLLKSNNTEGCNWFPGSGWVAHYTAKASQPVGLGPNPHLQISESSSPVSETDLKNIEQKKNPSMILEIGESSKVGRGSVKVFAKFEAMKERERNSLRTRGTVEQSKEERERNLRLLNLQDTMRSELLNKLKLKGKI